MALEQKDGSLLSTSEGCIERWKIAMHGRPQPEARHLPNWKVYAMADVHRARGGFNAPSEVYCGAEDARAGLLSGRLA